ncbi:hypothetical protein CVT24_011598 [Panaeolus cyanescens]|uniref:Uncharacterized protein n=1 Tax=Panaeolus cyanescens TaxID=181874 RepID=A0A409YVC0_9AGAR|nr:hypothetical protein CVT24_011598 [Panaeolus cyanescens]
MGSLCSKPSTYEGGHTVLGSSATNTPGGSNAGRPPPPDHRLAAAEAAERRKQAAQKRGTNDANPNQGKLSGQLAKQNSSKPMPTRKEDERLVWD